MKKRQRELNRLRHIMIICFIVLFIEVIYVLYMSFHPKEVSLYFDGVNAIDKNSKYYVTVGSNNDNDKYYEKAKLSIYNKKLEKKNDKIYNIGFNSAFFGVVIDEDSIISVGSYEKEEEEHEESIRRGLIVKYDFSGNVIFEKDYQLLDNTKFTSVVSVEDGYIVTGQSVYKSTKIGSKEGGAILIKYDKDGELVWSRNFGNNKNGIFNDLIVTNDSIYAIGLSNTSVGIVVRYDLDGNVMTSREYNDMDELGFRSIVQVGDSIYCSGSHNGNGLLLNIDYDCNIKNQVVYDGDGDVCYHKIIYDDKEHLIVIGNLKNHSKKYHYDGVIGKYDLDLKELSVVSYGDERDDYFTDIEYVDGNYLVVGYSSYEDGSYMSKFIRYSDALKVLGVES